MSTYVKIEQIIYFKYVYLLRVSYTLIELFLKNEYTKKDQSPT